MVKKINQEALESMQQKLPKKRKEIPGYEFYQSSCGSDTSDMMIGLTLETQVVFI